MKDLYQRLYSDENLHYGSAEHNRCPGVRYFPRYSHWLLAPVIDLGCGTGDTVRHLISNGFDAVGADQITPKLEHCMQYDITQPIMTSFYRCAICIDVLEHVEDSVIGGLLQNISGPKRNVVTIHNGPSFERGCDMDLHVNKKSAEEWKALFETYWHVAEVIQLAPHRFMFLGEHK